MGEPRNVQRTKKITLPSALHRLAVLLIVVFVCLSATGCTHNLVRQVNETFNRAIDDLTEESSAWRSVLERAIEELPEEVRTTVRAELTNLLQRTIAASGEEFRCEVDFLGNRVLEELRRIQANFNGAEFQPTPVFCQTIPTSVDLDLEPDRRKTLEISGYNFDANPPISVFARRESSLVDLAPRLDRPSHYHLTLDLTSDDDFKFDNLTDSIIFEWKGASRYQVAVTPNLCNQSTDYVFPGTTAYYRPPHTRGDKDFFGNADMTATVRLLREENYIDAVIDMQAIQPFDDYTTAAGTSPRQRVYTAPPGQRIGLIGAPLEETRQEYDRDWEAPDSVDGDGIVERYDFRGDRNGDDAGVYTDVTVLFRTFPVQLIEAQDCQ